MTESLKKEIRREIRHYYPQLESLILWHDGKLVLEEYISGSLSALRLTASMEKSLLLASAVGILLQKGLLPHLKTPLEDIFPDEFDRMKADRARKITLFHIMTNTTGLDWPGPDRVIDACISRTPSSSSGSFRNLRDLGLKNLWRPNSSKSSP